MNKKNIVTKENIAKVADWLSIACFDFEHNDASGCYNFPLSDELVLAVGWSDGYDMADTNIIKSKEDQRRHGSWTCGYAVTAGIKVRNDSDCTDYDMLCYPCYKDGECWDSGITMKPNKTRKEYRKDARWFLETFVDITNAYEKGEISYE